MSLSLFHYKQVSRAIRMNCNKRVLIEHIQNWRKYFILGARPREPRGIRTAFKSGKSRCYGEYTLGTPKPKALTGPLGPNLFDKHRKQI